MDQWGNLYIADNGNQRIRKVIAATGIITTIAGTGQISFSGDGGPATNAALAYPSSVAVDEAGKLYIADEGNHRVRRVEPSGVITTVAGTGSNGLSGDEGPAITAQLDSPTGLALDNLGNLYISDMDNHRVRKVSISGDTTLPAFGPGALISPINDAVVTSRRPVLDWAEAVDPLSGVGSYTLVLTGPDQVGSLQAALWVTTTESIFTPTVDLADGVYRWTVRAHDAAGNAGPFISPAARFVIAVEEGSRVYLPLILK